MFKENLITLRKVKNLSQEELAEKIGISRQTLSKYETGESLPDIEKCRLLAEILEVTLDDLVKYDSDKEGLMIPPKGKHAFGVVRLLENGQIEIPLKAREVFDLKPGDRIIVLGEDGQGLALVKEQNFMNMINWAREGR